MVYQAGIEFHSKLLALKTLVKSMVAWLIDYAMAYLRGNKQDVS